MDTHMHTHMHKASTLIHAPGHYLLTLLSSAHYALITVQCSLRTIHYPLTFLPSTWYPPAHLRTHPQRATQPWLLALCCWLPAPQAAPASLQASLGNAVQCIDSTVASPEVAQQQCVPLGFADNGVLEDFIQEM